MAKKNHGHPLSFRLVGDLGPRFEKVVAGFHGDISESGFARSAVRAAVEAVELEGGIAFPMKFSVKPARSWGEVGDQNTA